MDKENEKIKEDENVKLNNNIEEDEEEIERKEYEKQRKDKRFKTICWTLFIIAVLIYLSTYIASNMFLKPIIYLYPEEETSLVVKLGSPEKLTCTYPKYKETGWDVTAFPDGTLIDNETGRKLYSLYWEGKDNKNIEFNEGFCVKGEDTIKFLEEKLEVLGLTEREAEEFIVYWLPKMENNKYNLIRFATMEEIENNMPIEFSVEPDTVIRVLMQFKPVNRYVEIPEQVIETPERTGFVAVEWGGTEVK